MGQVLESGREDDGSRRLAGEAEVLGLSEARMDRTRERWDVSGILDGLLLGGEDGVDELHNLLRK